MEESSARELVFQLVEKTLYFAQTPVNPLGEDSLKSPRFGGNDADEKEVPKPQRLVSFGQSENDMFDSAVIMRRIPDHEAERVENAR